MAIIQNPNRTPAIDTRADDMRKLREEIEEADRGEGVPLSDEDFAAIRREIEDLERRNVQGGTSPTLERLIREREERRAATRA